MPIAKCFKCVSFTRCEHKKLNPGSYRFRLKCNGCGFIDEKIKRFNKSNECCCPFCGGIEKLNEIES